MFLIFVRKLEMNGEIICAFNSSFVFSQVRISNQIHLGLIHTRHFGTQYFVKKIKRHFWSNIFFHCVNWKYLFLSMDTRVCIENHNILKCHYNFLKNKLSFIEISFYRNIFLLQYSASKCLVWIRPYRDTFYNSGSE